MPAPRSEPEEPAARLVCARGGATFSQPAPGVILGVVTGIVTREVATLAIAHRTRALLTVPRVHVFDDTWEATGYESEARIALTHWAKEHAAQVGSIHFLARSKLVAMGVTVANLALRQAIRVYTSREAFAAALADACRR